MVDMAVGIPHARGVLVTAWKYKCRLCGREFWDISRSGWKQLGDGYHPDKVFDWMESRMTEGEKDGSADC